MELSKIVAVLGLASVLSLALPALAQRPTPTPEALSDTDSYHLSLYQGEGFSLLIPSNAIVRRNQNGTVVLGPLVDFRSVTTGAHSMSWAYSLTIKVHDNPDELSGEDFARRDIARMFENARAIDAPLGGLPVDSDGRIDEEATSQRTVAGQPAFGILFFGFDSLDHHLFISRGNRIYEIVIEDTSYDRHPLAQVQMDVYALMLATLSFTD